MKSSLKSYAVTVSQIFIGDIIYALAVVMFIVPCGLITGGTTGLALFFNHIFGFSVSVYVMISNFLMFALGSIVLGKKFAVSTIAGTVAYPLILSFLENLPIDWKMTDDPMLAVVCAGVMLGVGIGMIVRTDASGGGLDVIPLILNKKAGVPISVTFYIMDVAILILQIAIAQREAILYGILLVLGYTLVMDKALLWGKSLVRSEIVTEKYTQLGEEIQEKMSRGVTYLNAETGYLHKNCMMVMTITSAREVSKLKKLVADVDPTAFMVVERISEVQRGRKLYQ